MITLSKLSAGTTGDYYKTGDYYANGPDATSDVLLPTNLDPAAAAAAWAAQVAAQNAEKEADPDLQAGEGGTPGPNTEGPGGGEGEGGSGGGSGNGSGRGSGGGGLKARSDDDKAIPEEGQGDQDAKPREPTKDEKTEGAKELDAQERTSDSASDYDKASRSGSDASPAQGKEVEVTWGKAPFREVPLQWVGKTAALLGLSGMVTDADRERALMGFNPNPEGPALSHLERQTRDYSEALSEWETRLAQNAERPRPDPKIAREAPPKAPKFSPRTPGWDITFSPAKEVMFLAHIGVPGVMEAVLEGAYAALAVTEDRLIRARLRTKSYGTLSLAPDNLLAAVTVHGTNRANEPGVHVHAVLFNATHAQSVDLTPEEAANPQKGGILGKDDTLLAIDSRHMYKYRELQQRVAHQRVGEKLKELGFDIFYDQHGLVRLEGFPEAAIDQMSSRSKQIRENIEKLGGPSQANRRLAQLMDRPNKERVSPEAMMAKNREMIRKYGIDDYVIKHLARDGPGKTVEKQIEMKVNPFTRAKIALGNVFSPVAKEKSPYDYGPNDTGRGLDRPARAVMASVVHQSEQREAVFDSDKLVALALTLNPEISLARYEAQIREMKEARLLIAADAHRPKALTTKITLETEQKILKTLAQGRGKGAPLLDLAAAETLASMDQVGKGGQTFTLNAGQQRALIEIVTTPDRYIVINGDAGVGKTTLFRGLTALPARDRAEFIGFKGPDQKRKGETESEFKGIAPKNKQAAELGDALGTEVRTVAWLTTRFSHLATDAQAKPRDFELAEFKGKRIILDEAFTLDNFEFLKVLTIFEKLEVKSVIWSGDLKQSSAPGGPGAPLTNAVKTNALDTTKVSENTRQQQKDMRNAADSAAAMNPTQALKFLGNRVMEITDAPEETLALEAARLWTQAYAQGVDRQVIVTTQSMRTKVDANIRAELIANRRISTEQLTAPTSTYRSKHLTNAEIRRAGSYDKGDILVFHGNVRDLGFAANDRFAVTGVTTKDGAILGLIKLNGKDAGVEKTVQLGRLVHRGIRFDVFTESEKIALHENIRQTWGKTDAKRGIRAGETFTPIRADDRTVTVRLENKSELTLAKNDGALRFVEPGYADTTHRVQGATYNAWPIFASLSYHITHTNFYIAITRGRSGMTLLTDSYNNLYRNVTRDGTNAIARDNLPEAARGNYDAVYQNHLPNGVVEAAPDKLKEARALSHKQIDELSDSADLNKQNGLVYRVKTRAEVEAYRRFDTKTIGNLSKGLGPLKENPFLEAQKEEQRKQLELVKEKTLTKSKPRFGIQ